SGPEPRHGDVLGVLTKLRSQQGPPEHAVDLGPHPSLDPRRGRLRFEAVVIALELQVRECCSEADALGERQWGEAQERARRIHAVDLAVVQGTRVRTRPDKLVAQAHLGDEPLDIDVRAEEMMVKALEMAPA